MTEVPTEYVLENRTLKKLTGNELIFYQVTHYRELRLCEFKPQMKLDLNQQLLRQEVENK